MLYLSLEMIEAAAKDTIDGLEQAALRTIRQRDQMRGAAILQEIEGVEDFLQELRMRSRSEISRRNGDVIEHDHGQATVIRKISELRHRHRVGNRRNGDVIEHSNQNTKVVERISELHRRRIS